MQLRLHFGKDMSGDDIVHECTKKYAIWYTKKMPERMRKLFKIQRFDEDTDTWRQVKLASENK